MAGTALVVFTRDLRLRDHPALAEAARNADHLVPLFVFDDSVLGTRHASPNRLGFMVEAVTDLDRSLRDRGSALAVRRGDWVTEVLATAAACGATAVHLSDDHSAYARSRFDRLRVAAGLAGVDVRAHPGITVVPPGDLSPGTRGGAEYKVFTPYFRRWGATGWRAPLAVPEIPPSPAGLAPGAVPTLAELIGATAAATRSPHVAAGGETEGLARLKAWAEAGLGGYGAAHDDLAGDATSRVSPYLHAGCLSPLEVATRLRDRPGAGPFVRQLCWRDFYHQVLAARPDAARADYRPRGDVWQDDDHAFDAWQRGATGFPIVDAGMRQLAAEGWMHNRARLITASFLTKDLYVDWRRGAGHFLDLLVDGDLANNQLNWQWVAGTGNDTNRFRVFNPLRQAERFDPAGEYVRRYVPELADLGAPAIHDPTSAERAARGYPEPLVDHREAVAEYRRRTGGTRPVGGDGRTVGGGSRRREREVPPATDR